MPETEAQHTPYNPFDLTKVWPHRDYPLIEAGALELNRNPETQKHVTLRRGPMV